MSGVITALSGERENQGRPRRVTRTVLGRRISLRSATTVGLLLAAAVAVQSCSTSPIGGMGPGGMGGGGMMGSSDFGSTGANAPTPLPGATEIHVVAGDLYFEPNELRIRAGETVNLVLDNRGAAFHDLTIGDLDFVLSVQPGDRASGALTVARPGTYEFICSVPGHAQAGMRGELVVE